MSVRIKEWDGKNIIVTGGSSGIGLATACLLANKGANVWLLARNLQRLQAALEEVNTYRKYTNQTLNILSVDISNRVQVYEAISHLITQAGHINLLINNAGESTAGYFHDLTLNDFQAMIDVNYLGAVNMIKVALPYMPKDGTGYIVNISSLVGIINVFGYTAYGASKAALKGFSDALRMELRPMNIGLSVVFPPDTDTVQYANDVKMRPKEIEPLARIANIVKPELVANDILKGIRRGNFYIFPGRGTRLWFLLNGWINGTMNRVIEYLIAHARKNMS